MRISDWSSDVCSSDLGHAAQFLSFHTLMEPGCEIVAARKLYGGSQNQLGQRFRKMAWTTHFVDADDAGNVAAALSDKTRAVFFENPPNPGGGVPDHEAIAQGTPDAGERLLADKQHGHDSGRGRVGTTEET